jgi:hypothetical protein
MITLLTGSSALALLQETMLSRSAFGPAPRPSDQQNASQQQTAATLPQGYGPWNQVMLVGFTESYKGVSEVDAIQDPLGSPSTDGAERNLMEDRQPVAIEEQNLSYSSQEIDDVLSSGGGLMDVSSTPEFQRDDTVQDLIGTIKSDGQLSADNASLLKVWLAEGRPVGPMAFGSASMDLKGSAQMATYSDDVIESYINSFQKDAAVSGQEASSMETAFQNHQMTFAKAIDVSGLDYSETDTYVDHGGFYETGSEQVSYNSAMLGVDANGEEHNLINLGGIEIYASWPSQQEAIAETTVTQTTIVAGST